MTGPFASPIDRLSLGAELGSNSFPSPAAPVTGVPSPQEDSMDQLRLIPTVWARFPHIADVAPLGDQDREVLAEIRAVLEKHGALERFGVNLIHRHFELLEGEVLLEATEMDSRRQIVEVRPEAEVVGGDVIATQWVFGTRGEGMACKLYCNYQDYAHKTRHATINVEAGRPDLVASEAAR
jgi:hypothetical protein